MRVVVDTNCLNSDKLRKFLEQSRDNKAVVTYFVALESFKGGGVQSILNSWGVLEDFPGQILVLKTPRAAGLVDPCAAGIADRFIDKKETKGVVNFPRILRSAVSGDRGCNSKLQQRKRWAHDEIDRMRVRSQDFNSWLEKFGGFFSDQEIGYLRRKDLSRYDVRDKFLEFVLDSASEIFREHPDRMRRFGCRHMVNHFIFRHALSYCVYMMHLFSNGTIRRRTEKVINDNIDVVNAAFATYFNGFMCNDKGACLIYRDVRGFLVQLGARVPPFYEEACTY